MTPIVHIHRLGLSTWIAAVADLIGKTGRQLRSAPLFSAAVILTTGLALAATTTVLAAVDGILFKPLPFTAPSSLVLVQTLRRGSAIGMSVPDFLDLRSRLRTFSELAAGNNVSTANLSGGGLEPEHVRSVRVTANFFHVLGATILLGRPFLGEDEVPGGPYVAIISAALWHRQFGNDRTVVGRTIEVDGQATTVVGVLASGQELPFDADMWTPLQLGAAARADNRRSARFLRLIVGRRTNAASNNSAQREIDGEMNGLARAHPTDDAGLTARVVDLNEALTGSVRVPLEITSTAVALLLLISIANVVNLYSVRSRGRELELSVRVALGADLSRLVIGQLTQAFLLTFVGATLGLLLGGGGLAILRSLAGGALPRLDSATISPRVIGVVVAVAALMSGCFAALPALRASRADVATLLRAAGRGGGGLRADKRRMRSVAIAVQLALAFSVLIPATLLARSFQSLLAVDLGFRPAGIVGFELSLLGPRYSSPDRIAQFVGGVETRLRQLPNVRAVGVTSAMPLSPANLLLPYAIADGVVSPVDEQATAQTRMVSPGYFGAMGLSAMSGRSFEEGDGVGAPPVVIVDQSFARAAFPNQNPLGRRILISTGRTDPQVSREIVGVVGDTRINRIDIAPAPTVYIPIAQAARDGVGVVIRTDASIARIGPAIRDLVHELDPTLPIASLEPLSDTIRSSLTRQRMFAILLAAFAVAACVLAAGGLYAVTASAVAERRREIAIKSALGASPTRLILSVLAQSAFLGAMGVLAGGIGAALLAHAFASLLFGVGIVDATTYAIAIAAMMTVVLLASVVPAFRAATTSPLLAMTTS